MSALYIGGVCFFVTLCVAGYVTAMALDANDREQDRVDEYLRRLRWRIDRTEEDREYLRMRRPLNARLGEMAVDGLERLSRGTTTPSVAPVVGRRLAEPSTATKEASDG